MKDLINKYGFFVVGGLIGAIIHRIKTRMSFKAFLGTLVTSAFVGVCVGILMRNYLDVSEEVVFVGCSMAGVFSKDLLEEIEEIIKMISEYVRKKLDINDEIK